MGRAMFRSCFRHLLQVLPWWSGGLVALAAAGPTVTYAPGPLPQVRVAATEEAGSAVQLTLLAPGLVHLAWSPRLQPGQVWTTTMLARREFAGVEDAVWDARRQRLTGGGVSVTRREGCWQLAVNRQQRVAEVCLQRQTRGRLRLTVNAEGPRQVLGLGQQLIAERVSPDWNGLRRLPGHALGNAMVWDGSLGAAGNTQVPVAYVLSDTAPDFALFLDTPYAVQADFAEQPWRLEAADGSAGLFIWTGRDVAALRQTWLDLSGHPPVPPLKAFGLWLSEFGFDNWAELDDKVASLRRSGFALDGAVLDLQWFGGIRSGSPDTAMGRLDWDETAFPAAREHVRDYARKGLGLMLIEESYIGAGRPEFAQLASQRGLAMQCPPPCTEPVVLEQNPWWGVGGMLDWSNGETSHAWHVQKRVPLIDAGILGHWTDLGEPEQFDEWAYYSGVDWYGRRATRHRDLHNLYNFLWSRSIADETARSHPDRRPWILSRSGAAGSQRYGVALWSGDLLSGFPALAAQVQAQTNMSLSGFDYYGADIGGFHRGTIRPAEMDRLYTRWLAGSVLMDVPLRPHAMNLCNCHETAPDRIGDIASNRANVALRYRLVPYFYSVAHAAWREGRAVVGPLALEFGDLPGVATISGSKLLGPWMLFAPPVADAEQVQVWLPPGRWTDFYHPEQVSVGQGDLRAVPATRDGVVRAPLYLREGAIVPLLTQAPAHLGAPQAGQIHWFSDVEVQLVPGAQQTTFDLVEDDGVSQAYQRGQLARTRLALQAAPGSGWHLSIHPDVPAGVTARRRWQLNVFGVVPDGARLLLNGMEVPQLQSARTAASECPADDCTARAVHAPAWWRVPGGVHVDLGEHAVTASVQVRLAAAVQP